MLSLRHQVKKACSVGKFTLSSGKESDFYIDCRQVTLDGDALFQISLDICRTAYKLQVSVVAGPASAAIPLISSAALSLVAKIRTVACKDCLIVCIRKLFPVPASPNRSRRS